MLDDNCTFTNIEDAPVRVKGSFNGPGGQCVGFNDLNQMVWLDNDDSDQWNTSVGGGVFLSLANMITTNISAFNSDDGLRLAFRLGFGF